MTTYVFRSEAVITVAAENIVQARRHAKKVRLVGQATGLAKSRKDRDWVRHSIEATLGPLTLLSRVDR